MKVRIVSLLLLIFSSAASAQGIYGTWINPQYNATMTLNQDATFTFQGPYGQSSGTWAVQDQWFYMQDAYGQVSTYTILNFSEQAFKLEDVNGAAFNYVRPEQPTQQATGKLLAESGGYHLASANIKTGVGIIQFIVGEKITEKEADALTKVGIEEFQAHPEAFIRQVQRLDQSLNTLRSLQDPIQIGTIRQMLIAEFYKATAQIPESEKPLMIQIINRYVSVLAFDAASNLVLTDDDVDAMIDYIEFSNQLSGINQTFSTSDRQQFQQQLVNQFSTLPIEQKQLLTSARMAWNLVQNNWQNMNQAQRTQIQQNYTGSAGIQNLHRQQGSISNPPQQDNSGNVTQQDLAKMQREHMAQQNMFTMMNNMSLGTHATMLNTIENFGGTGNYWEVTDMPY